MLGLVLFSVASFAASRPIRGWLIAARAVRAFGAAIVSPAALSITHLPSRGCRAQSRAGRLGRNDRRRGAAGVLLGGILTSGLNWRWVLFVNVPIGIAAAAARPPDAVESRARTEREHSTPRPFTVTAGLSPARLRDRRRRQRRLGSSRTLLEIAVAVILLVAS